jgi:DNA-binding response OmpR family regulator
LLTSHGHGACRLFLTVVKVSDSNAKRHALDEFMLSKRTRTQRCILVIEDYTDSREMLKLLLEGADYRVITAKDGKEALALAASENIDLILTDLGLPDMSGVTLVRALRRLNDQLSHVPIIVLTAFEGSEEHISPIHGWCTAYLKKPLDFDELEGLLNGYLREPVGKHGHEAIALVR